MLILCGFSRMVSEIVLQYHRLFELGCSQLSTGSIPTSSGVRLFSFLFADFVWRLALKNKRAVDHDHTSQNAMLAKHRFPFQVAGVYAGDGLRAVSIWGRLISTLHPSTLIIM